MLTYIPINTPHAHLTLNLGEETCASLSWFSKLLSLLCLNEQTRDYYLHSCMTNLDGVWKSRDITLLTKVHIVKAMVFSTTMCGCESWTIKKTEHWRTDAFCSLFILIGGWFLYNIVVFFWHTSTWINHGLIHGAHGCTWCTWVHMCPPPSWAPLPHPPHLIPLSCPRRGRSFQNEGKEMPQDVSWSSAGVQPPQDPGGTLRMNGIGEREREDTWDQPW